MMNVLEELSLIGIVPVIAIDDAEKSEDLAGALVRGGLPCAEITFRTAAAEESIKRITAAYPDMLIGAGTVLNTDQAKRAVEAGARFIVSPGFSEEVVRYCLDNDIPVVPGIMTPTELQYALGMGLDTVKFFPAEPAGGLKMIKAMSAPYPNVRFMPTGGLNIDNVRDYLGTKCIFTCGGSWMAPKKLISEDRFDDIEDLTKEAVRHILQISSVISLSGTAGADGRVAEAVNIINGISEETDFNEDSENTVVMKSVFPDRTTYHLCRMLGIEYETDRIIEIDGIRITVEKKII